MSSTRAMITPPPSKPPTPKPSFLRATIELNKENSAIKTIPELIEFNARENGKVPFCLQMQKNGETISISHRQLQYAIHRCRKHLLKTIPEIELPFKGPDDTFVKGAPIALFGESNAVLVIHLLALVSMGIPVSSTPVITPPYQYAPAETGSVFLRFPVAIQHLSATTKAVAIIASERLRSTADTAIGQFEESEARPIVYVQTGLDNLFQEDEDFDYEKSICSPGHYISETDRNVLILHSSGTTGLPKAIYTSHRYMLSFTTCHDLSAENETQRPCLSTLPLYHGFGLIAPLLSMGIGMPFCLPPPSVIPTGPSIIHQLQATGAQSLITVPSLLEEVTQIPGGKGIDLLSTLQFVAFGGGQLKPAVGEKLSAAGVRLVNHYGTTESGPLAPLFVPGDDYDYRFFRLRKDIKLRIDPLPVNNETEKKFSLTTYPYGWGTEFKIQDQLVQNPLHPGSDFNAVGRNDDVIVLATGEKVLPSFVENYLSDDERVGAAVCFGDRQFEIGVLVQPASHIHVPDVEAYKKSIWPVIQQANQKMDAQGRISGLDSVVVLSPDEGLPRSDKGSIMRREVYKKFEDRINEVYNRLELHVDSVGVIDMENLESEIQNYIQNTLNWRVPAGQWSYENDLFELGMDSLQAVQLRRFLLGCLGTSKSTSGEVLSERIPRDFVYTHPSVSQIAKALRDPNPIFTAGPSHDTINQLLNEFTVPNPTIQTEKEDKGATVLLTGATGSLGAHTLTHLVSLPSISRVVCLNRPQNTTHPILRQQQSLSEKGLHLTGAEWTKVDVIETHTAEPLLGLSLLWYTHLKENVTHILHAAWPMDFKRKVGSFRSSLQTLQNLISLAKDAHSIHPQIRPRLLFVSSIAVVGKYPVVTGETMVPEEVMSRSECANEIGYGHAKLVCERMLEGVEREGGREMEVGYVRVGQMSGSEETGYWNEKEHLPALFKGIQLTGKLPKLQGTLSWIPVNHAASVVSDILLTPSPLNLVYHVENPLRQPWHDLLLTLSNSLNLPITETLPFPQWLVALQSVSSKDNSSQAMKLVEFFEEDFERMACGNVVMDTYQARRVSGALRKVSVVKEEVVERYVRYWRGCGFLK
ncbi:acetyl-CoA synthetase-like protein [Delitschia confertaspora ATCC 74209]|uniref:Acetyl-CoA synthetase-like protein n=1 Tax=Delitschia confertaspora ATCC 74209 TaxID=1513339 RepID=A0A9P4JUQ0_9PLEO|nr:acetyl-CoA synthetase-like protein [Delitschia confertaspora ATCC 74209]